MESSNTEDFTSTISKVQEEINNNSEWKSRFATYANDILSNKHTIIDIRKKFHNWKNFSTYLSVGSAKSNKIAFDLRYKGQSVATLTVKSEKVLLSLKDNIEMYFGFPKTTTKEIDWNSTEATHFRNYFGKNPDRIDNEKNNEEHRIENILLKEFSKTNRNEKILLGIQPVVMLNIKGLYYQMCTPISASKQPIKYSRQYGGGIDILARINRKLSIIEVKDENKGSEPPRKVINQAIAYATFIAQLLRSDSGENWWNIFGFKNSPPKSLTLNIIAAMPFPSDNSIPTFANNKIEVIGTNIFLELHYIFFKEQDNRIVEIQTSLSN